MISLSSGRLPLALLLLIGASAATAHAQVATGSQMWLQGLAIGRLSPNWRMHLEEQPRWDEDATSTYQVLTRTAIGRQIGPRLSIWGGHAWVVKPNPVRTAHEQRLWQQVSVTVPMVGGWSPLIRVRVEQRWQDGWADSSHRLRLMGRGVRRLSKTGPWSAILWGESFFGLDETAAGPPQGVDQHRLFAGTARRVSPKATVEAGYLHVIARRPALPMKQTPGGLVVLNLSL